MRGTQSLGIGVQGSIVRNQAGRNRESSSGAGQAGAGSINVELEQGKRDYAGRATSFAEVRAATSPAWTWTTTGITIDLGGGLVTPGD